MIDYDYVLPLDLTYSPQFPKRPAEKITNLASFLKEPEDVHLIEKLTRYEVPITFLIEEAQNESGGKESFLCVTTFPDKQNEYIWIYTLPPHLAGMLYKGSKIPDNLLYLKSPPQRNTEIIADKALNSHDIAAIYGQTGFSEVFAVIVHKLLDIDVTPQKESLEEYKNRIKTQNQPDFILADQIEEVKTSIQSYCLTYKSAIETLNAIYSTVPAHIGEESQKAFNNLISDLSLSAFSKPNTSLKRVKQIIYALPCNAAAYEDNGGLVIQEALIHLEAENIKEDFEDLKRPYEETEEWFNKIKNVRKRLLIALHLGSTYVSQAHKNSMESVLNQIILDVRKYEEIRYHQKNKILLKYLEDIQYETLSKYLNPLDDASPFIHKGTAVINIDACKNEDKIIKTAASAERLIVLGSYDNDLFRVFLKAAFWGQQKDGITRMVHYASELSWED